MVEVRGFETLLLPCEGNTAQPNYQDKCGNVQCWLMVPPLTGDDESQDFSSWRGPNADHEGAL